MRNAVAVLVISASIMASNVVRADQLEMQAAAMLAFNAASACHANEMLYKNVVEARSGGHSDQKIKEAAQVAPGSETEHVVDQALKESGSGTANPKAYYDRCMKRVKNDVYMLLQGGKTS